jgi:hypothetical protein
MNTVNRFSLSRTLMLFFSYIALSQNATVTDPAKTKTVTLSNLRRKRKA